MGIETRRDGAGTAGGSGAGGAVRSMILAPTACKEGPPAPADGLPGLAGCRMASCRYHREGTGCAFARGVLHQDAAQLLGPGGGLDQEECPLLDILLSRLERASRNGTRERRRPESLSDLFLLLCKTGRTANGGPLSMGYLVAAASNASVDRIRHEEGRPRCGSCTSYGWTSRRCLRRGAPYVQEIRPDTDPGSLAPACLSFRSIRERANGGVPSVSTDVKPPEVERLERALAILRRSDPRAAALIVEHHLEGVSLREIARTTRGSRRSLARELREAQEKLGVILEDLA